MSTIKTTYFTKSSYVLIRSRPIIPNSHVRSHALPII